MFFRDLIEALERHRVRYAVVGGYAVALHGAIRGTVDVDLVIALEEEQFSALEQALGSIGLAPRLPVTATEVYHFREEFIQRRNMVAWSFANPKNPLELVDVLIGYDANHLETMTKRIGDYSARVASIDALIEMKKQSDRPQDREDIKALEKLR